MLDCSGWAFIFLLCLVRDEGYSGENVWPLMRKFSAAEQPRRFWQLEATLWQSPQLSRKSFLKSKSGWCISCLPQSTPYATQGHIRMHIWGTVPTKFQWASFQGEMWSRRLRRQTIIPGTAGGPGPQLLFIYFTFILNNPTIGYHICWPWCLPDDMIQILTPEVPEYLVTLPFS